MSTTIETLAQDFSIEAHGVRAALNLGDALTDQTPIDEFDGWTEAEAREVLTVMAEQADASN